MIRIVLSVNRELIHFIIIDKYIYYTDRKLKMYVRCLPKPEKLLDIQKGLSRMFEFTEEELAEYANYQTEEEIAAAVIKDASLKACRLIIKKSAETSEGLRNLIKDKEVITLGELT
jgi:hypothetical protein